MGNSEIIFLETSLVKNLTLSRYWEKFPPQGIKSPGNFPELAFDSLKTSQQTLQLKWNSGLEAKPHCKNKPENQGEMPNCPKFLSIDGRRTINAIKAVLFYQFVLFIWQGI